MNKAERNRIAALHVARREVGWVLQSIEFRLREATAAYRVLIDNGWCPPTEIAVRAQLELANNGQLSLSTLRELVSCTISLPELPNRSGAAVKRAEELISKQRWT